MGEIDIVIQLENLHTTVTRELFLKAAREIRRLRQYVSSGESRELMVSLYEEIRHLRQEIADLQDERDGRSVYELRLEDQIKDMQDRIGLAAGVIEEIRSVAQPYKLPPWSVQRRVNEALERYDAEVDS